MSREDLDSAILDQAARAGWLYYVGGSTQDEIAKMLGVSRQRAQRLVSKAVADGLIRVRIEHPIAELMELGRRLRERYELRRVRIAPDLGAEGNMRSLAPFAAQMMEEVLQSKEPRIIGFGTGRALRASVDELMPMEAKNHKILSIIGNVTPDGRANFYDVLMRIADLTRAPHYPLMTPVLAETVEEREAYMRLTAVQKTYELAKSMDTVFVGIGQFDETAPMRLDGFITQDEWRELRALGAIGEIGGRVYDSQGNYLDAPLTARITSIKVQASPGLLSVGIAAGARKVEAIRAALESSKINGLVTDEPTVRALLQSS